jgi:hypothetical protein
MKNTIAFLLLALLSLNASAQPPQKMSYQAVIRNTNNNLVTNTTIGMKISLLQGGASGSTIYSELHFPSTNSNGLVSLEIGGGTVVNGNFSTISWNNGPYFVKTETDPSGGTNYSITGTSQLLSVPYALYSERSGTATGGGNFTHYIGEAFAGGIIFHLYKDSAGIEHGLVVALTNLSTNSFWATSPNSVYSQPTSFRDGKLNTTQITAFGGLQPTDAVSICTQYAGGGYNDWYLPSIKELNLLYDASYDVDANPSIFDLDKYTYWSSTSNGINFLTAYVKDFSTGEGLPRTWYQYQYYVRPIRQF